MTNAGELLRTVGLAVGGTIRWGDRVPSPAPGVYVVATPEPMTEPPIDTTTLRAWVDRLPAMRVDGRVPTVESLHARLREFWIPGETVVYIGLAGTSLATRVGHFYRTPLGDRAPHAGGHWLKTLDGLDDFTITWAETTTPDEHEDALLRAFADALPGPVAARLPAGPVLPFANLETGGKVRKAHGITGSRVAKVLNRSASLTTRVARSPKASIGAPTGTKATLTDINAAIQRLACNQPDHRVTAVEAAAELDRLNLLRDSRTRPGKPLRDLLRNGAIDHAYQEAGRFWFIDCAPDCWIAHAGIR